MGGYDTRFTEILLGICALLALISFIGSLGEDKPKNINSNHKYSDDGYYDGQPDPYNDIYAP